MYAESMRRLFALLLGACLVYAQPRYDLVLRRPLIDPKNNIDARMDIAMRDGRVAAVAPRLDGSIAGRVIRVEGLVVTPGLVDLHTHLFTSTSITAPGRATSACVPTIAASAPESPPWWRRAPPVGAISRNCAST